MTAAGTGKKKETNVKETIESILVAFILAFVFRCFVIEAFVIPTGSMAPTLLGAHMEFRCTHCGYNFTAGYGVPPGNFSLPAYASGTYNLFCPNCGLRIPEKNDSDPAHDATRPAVRYGDRILVMKYIYLLNEPRRFDVVVFKSPETDTATPGDYSTNFIKRLVGKPGESLFAAQGDLYVAEPGASPDLSTSYHVQTKPRWAQDALWRIVFDADYIPQPAPEPAGPVVNRDEPWRQPWQRATGSGWINNDATRGVTARQFVFDNPNGDGILEFNAAANPNKSALTDWLAYDEPTIAEQNGYNSGGYGGFRNGLLVNEVSDLKLSAVIDTLSGTGAMRLLVGKGSSAFVAEFTPHRVRLIQRRAGTEKILGEAAAAIESGTSVSIQNVDYQVTVRINDRDILQSTPEQYSPDVASIVAELRSLDGGSRTSSPHGWAQIEGSRAQFQLSHLQLWRDVYYRDSMGASIRRATAFDFPKNVVRLGADEYFVMGDNSIASSDARMWTQSVNLIRDENLYADAGRVPERFLLGQAFFVYWPAGYQPMDGVPALIPNFGQMRFIR